MRKSLSVASLTILSAILVPVLPVAVAAQTTDNCHDILNAAVSDGEASVQSLNAVDMDCRKHPYYYYLVGKAHIDAKRYDEARSALAQGLRNPGGYERRLELAVADIALHRHEYVQAAERYAAVTDKFPDWHIGFERLGFAHFAAGNPQAARTALQDSIEILETADAYRTLTLVTYQMNDFEASIDALNRGFSLNERLLGDRDFMIAGVRAYTELGRFDIARGLLAAMLNANDAFRDDQEYLRAGLYLRQKMVEAGVLGE